MQTFTQSSFSGGAQKRLYSRRRPAGAVYATLLFFFLLAVQLATAQSGCTGTTATPVITSESPTCNVSVIQGWTTEPTGTVITLYRNGTIKVGSSISQNGVIGISLDKVDAAVGDQLTITATASGKCESAQSNAVSFTNGARYYADKDNDGWGSTTDRVKVCADNPQPPSGYKANVALGDCDDNDPEAYPTQFWYADKDQDGYGTLQGYQITCKPGPGYISKDKVKGPDCDDNDKNIWNGVQIYVDADGDGYDNGSSVVCYATTPPPGPQTTKGHDCNDNNAAVWRTGTFYKDADGDGFTLSTAEQFCYGTTPPAGYQATKSAITDCNDNLTTYADADGDGYGSAVKVACGGVTNNGDCNDGDSAINPLTVWVLDADGDTYYTGTPVTQCSPPRPGYVIQTTQQPGDCDDGLAFVNPQTEWKLDADLDGYYSGQLVKQCQRPGPDYFLFGFPGDCNDGDNTIYPGAPEIAGDGIDQNCDGADETIFYRDLDGDGFGNKADTVHRNTQPPGYVTDNSDCNDNLVLYQDADSDGFGSTIKAACDGVTNNTDCNDADKSINPTIQWVLDADKDGFYTGNPVTRCTSPGAGYTLKTNQQPGDCNDAAVAVNPGAAEICDGIDNDCDGQVDEGVGDTWYRDSDGDGFGNPSVSLRSCTRPAGYVANSQDCDDTKTTYQDSDGDGVGAGPKVACGNSTTNTDCNDGDKTIYPGAPDVPDGKDNNCDGVRDNGGAVTFYRDFDGDGFGDPGQVKQSSTPLAGYVANNLDCNDYRTNYQDLDGDGVGSMVKVPCGQTITNSDCNDNDRTVNSPQIYYQDNDKDGYGDAGKKIMACSSKPPAGYVANSIDCNDNNAALRLPVTYYRDADGDGFGNVNGKSTVCQITPPPGYVANTQDCNDGQVLYQDNDKDGFGSATKVACGGVTNNLDCNDNNAAIKACTLPSVTMQKGVGASEQVASPGLQALPNPFHTTTVLRYTVPEKAKVHLNVCDVLGREVHVLFDGERTPGTYTHTYVPNSLAPGTYYARIVMYSKGKTLGQSVKLVKAE